MNNRSPQRRDPSFLSRFPFPLRDNLDVVLSLPRDLTEDEAARLGVYIEALAHDGEFA